MNCNCISWNYLQTQNLILFPQFLKKKGVAKKTVAFPHTNTPWTMHRAHTVFCSPASSDITCQERICQKYSCNTENCVGGFQIVSAQLRISRHLTVWILKTLFPEAADENVTQPMTSPGSGFPKSTSQSLYLSPVVATVCLVTCKVINSQKFCFVVLNCWGDWNVKILKCCRHPIHWHGNQIGFCQHLQHQLTGKQQIFIFPTPKRSQSHDSVAHVVLIFKEVLSCGLCWQCAVESLS